ncbi:hypothetical protein O181_008109 [Austropuccinia psidii MF-1]|uniref:Uncharacterized protein n=1 Tax=Austropuccinia psidii MF-1 TaxID=1389203 RepID=A0A9Q3BN92_9BASI|nr:hypothetical protein [Austropuccinia psidii MF-1]
MIALMLLVVSAVDESNSAGLAEKEVDSADEAQETPTAEELAADHPQDDTNDTAAIAKIDEKSRGGPGHIGHRYCYMTSKPRRNCNAGTCRAGGGRCALNPSNRCQLYNPRGAFECRVACTCRVGYW